MLPTHQTPDLDTLVHLFYDDPQRLGTFDEVTADEMPEPYRELLAHHSHMTVTVERFHGGPVDVRVLDKRVSGTHYARSILLTRQSDGRIVQFGIMRINFDYVRDEVRREIERQSTPLGRVLIEHNVLRRVELAQLWRVEPGEELRKLFGLGSFETTYGRTATIHCNGEPAAVELLEIVAPV